MIFEVLCIETSIQSIFYSSLLQCLSCEKKVRILRKRPLASGHWILSQLWSIHGRKFFTLVHWIIWFLGIFASTWPQIYFNCVKLHDCVWNLIIGTAAVTRNGYAIHHRRKKMNVFFVCVCVCDFHSSCSRSSNEA